LFKGAKATTDGIRCLSIGGSLGQEVLVCGGKKVNDSFRCRVPWL